MIHGYLKYFVYYKVYTKHKYLLLMSLARLDSRDDSAYSRFIWPRHFAASVVLLVVVISGEHVIAVSKRTNAE